MPTIATIFSGGEGVGVGAKNAGFTHLWGIELKDEIAQVARDNGFNVITGDIFEIEPESLRSPDVLHASPECQRASVANKNRGETELDIALGKRVEDYITALQPKVFTLENVRPYKHFQAFKSIVNRLFELGYFVDYRNVCAADFGVPQTRHRLILRASRIGLLSMLPPKEKWIGWYEAIEDLIPTLPDDKFAPWQLERLEKMDLQPLLVGCRSKGAEWSNDIKQTSEPAQTLNVHTMQLKAVIVDDKYGVKTSEKRNVATRNETEPMFTIQTSHPIRAFIVEGRTGGNREILTRDDKEPIMTISASSGGNVIRAFVANGTPNNNGQDMTVIDGENRIFTIAASTNKRPLRALLVSGQLLTDNQLVLKGENEPAITVVSEQHKIPFRAWLSQGCVVAMTPRALARFQSFPDWYKLPKNKTVACKIIGNAVPPLMYQKIIEQFKVFL